MAVCAMNCGRILNNNGTFEVRFLYKMMWCSMLGNGNIHMKFRNYDC